MANLGQIRLFFPIIIISVLVVAMDAVIMPILMEYYGHKTLTMVLVLDFSVVFLAGLASLFFTHRVSYPLWYCSSNGASEPIRKTYIPVLLGLSITAANTLINLVYLDQTKQTAPWITLLTPKMAIAVSIRAALNEETVFRLFLFPLVTWIFLHLKRSKKMSLVAGALSSSIAFGFVHGSGFILAFLVGLAFVYVYLQRGLLPAMIMHFLADAIPFLLISMML